MKFTIDSITFKSVMERVMVVSKKKSAIVQTDYIVITADKNAGIVKFEVQQLDELLCVTIDYVRIEESGMAIIDTQEVKPLLSMTGMIEIEETGGEYFNASTQKKHSVIRAYNSQQDQLFEKPKIGKAAFTAGKREFIDTMQTLAPSLGENPNKPVYMSYFVDPKHSSMVVCSGFTLIVRKVNWKFDRANFDMLIPGARSGFLTSIKKITDYKHDEEMTVYVSDNLDWGTFQGKDFTYTFRLTDTKHGQFMDYSAFLDEAESVDVKFHLDVPETINVIGEYERCNTKAEMFGAFVVKVGDKLISGYSNQRYKTKDELTYRGEIPDGFFKMLDPAFFNIVLKVFRNRATEDCTIATNNNQYSPVHIYDDEYHALVVPMKMNPDESRNTNLLEFIRG